MDGDVGKGKSCFVHQCCQIPSDSSHFQTYNLETLFYEYPSYIRLFETYYNWIVLASSGVLQSWANNLLELVNETSTKDTQIHSKFF